MFITASSTWRVRSDDNYGIDGKERMILADVQIGTQLPTKFQLTGDYFCRWHEAEDQGQDKSSYLGLLTLAWSYILSARLVEMQGQKGAKMVYTDLIAIGYQYGAESNIAGVGIDIGNVDKGIAKWWAAILAPYQGSKAIISQQDDDMYQAPWSVSLNGTPYIGIKWPERELLTPSITVSTTVHAPPSSDEAFGLLADFNLLHNLGSQFSAALATALILPKHNYYSKVAQLPYPTQIRVSGGHTRPSKSKWNGPL